MFFFIVKMRLRAIWILSLSNEATLPLFSRCFSTVEACYKSQSGDAYINIPTDEEFVKALRLEVGLTDAGLFVESRDVCNKISLYPAFEISLGDDKSLWPVVVQENRGLIYCALPLVSKELYLQKLHGEVSLADIPGVSASIEALSGLAQCTSLTSNMTSLNPELTLQLHQYVSVCMPFGTIICSNPALTSQLINPVGKGKTKQPVWNPVPYKGKTQIVIQIKEEVRCIQSLDCFICLWSKLVLQQESSVQFLQAITRRTHVYKAGKFNHAEMKDAMDVHGTVTCKTEVEGTTPEICFTIIQPGGNDQNIDGGGMIVSPAVSNIEYTATTSRLRFRPCNNQPLSHYTLPHMTEPPIHGAYKLKVNNSLVTLNVQLQLQAGVKNQFQQLEVHIPFAGLQLSHIKPSPSAGSVSAQGANTLVWNIGTKFPARSLDATLNAVCKLKRTHKKGDTLPEQQSENIGWEQYINSYAMVLFKIGDYTFSGTKVDPQSITISTASKFRCSVTSECVSGLYKIWNSEGEVPTVADVPIQELQNLLIQE